MYPSNRLPRATNSLTPYSRVCEVPMQMREAHRAGLGAMAMLCFRWSLERQLGWNEEGAQALGTGECKAV